MTLPRPTLSRFSGPASWENHPWTAFRDAPPALALLPVYGLGTAPERLPLDIEEQVGTALLRSCLAQETPALRVLPPFRFGWSPLPNAYAAMTFGEAGHLLRELAESVKRSGVKKLALFSTSPWQLEWLADLSRDLRVLLGLETFFIPLRCTGLDFHPDSADFDATLALAGALSGRGAEPTDLPAPPRRPTLRPADASHANIVKRAMAPSIEALPRAADALAAVLSELTGLPITAASTVSTAPFQATAGAEKVTRCRVLSQLSWSEIQEAANEAHALVVIPTGAIEQHGPHLPVGVDSLLGAALAGGARAILDPTLPVFFGSPVVYGKSTEHQTWAGTLTVSAEALRAQLLAQIKSLRGAGFRRFAFLNTHGGNSATLVSLSRELEATGDLEVGLLLKPPSPAVATPLEAAWGFHAGEWETSLMLALAPDLVTLERAVREYPLGHDNENVKPEGRGAVRSWATEDLSKSGVVGDPMPATAEKGRVWFSEYVAALTKRLTEMTEPD
ncbi:creatininase family protein [Nibricoccus sp. IMCC34717]|uniref:creatininase family protein n=1 Tax=Nibricoccus sp. IMCC34717 TaxID=3034021 RepID=UPI00384AD1BD